MEEKRKAERERMREDISRDSVDLLAVYRILRQRWRFVAIFTGTLTALTLIVSLLLSPVYRATTVILPIDKSMPSLIEGSDLSSLINLIGMSGGSNASKIMAILKSNSIKENLIEKHDLMRLIFSNEWDEKRGKWEDEPPTNWDGIREMDDIVKVSEDRKTGSIGISVDFGDPVMASKISNWYVEELKSILNEKSFSMARHYRENVEKILIPIKEGLSDTERTMTKFQKEEGMIQPEAQTEVMIKVYAELIKEKSLREAQLKAYKDVLGDKNPEKKRIEAELSVIDEKIKEIEGKEKRSLMIPAGNLPDVGMEFAQKMRELKISEKAYEELLVQYYLAKFQETKEDVIFQIIDEAIPPDKPVRPKKLLYTAVGFITSLLFGIFIVVFRGDRAIER